MLDIEVALEDGTVFRLEAIPMEVRRVTY